MADKKERIFILEGQVAQTVFVRVKGTSLDDAVARAESGKFDIDEELKPDYGSWAWTEDTEVKASEDGVNFDVYDVDKEEETF